MTAGRFIFLLASALVSACGASSDQPACFNGSSPPPGYVIADFESNVCFKSKGVLCLRKCSEVRP